MTTNLFDEYGQLYGSGTREFIAQALKQYTHEQILSEMTRQLQPNSSYSRHATDFLIEAFVRHGLPETDREPLWRAFIHSTARRQPVTNLTAGIFSIRRDSVATLGRLSHRPFAEDLRAVYPQALERDPLLVRALATYRPADGLPANQLRIGVTHPPPSLDNAPINC